MPASLPWGPSPLLRRIAVVGAVAWIVPATVSAQDQQANLEGIGFTLGSESAPVSIVEYADFACSACAEFATLTWPTLLSDYVEAGLVHWRFVLFEIGFRNSDEGARAGQCGYELGAFWELHDLLYERHDSWVGDRNPEDELTALAVEVGLDEEEFRDCYDDDPGEDRTDAANRAARADAVRGTPTFFIDGFRVQGAIPLELFEEMIRAATGSAQARGSGSNP